MIQTTKIFLKVLLFSMLILLLFTKMTSAQAVPAFDENIPYLITFGKAADRSWGDDDHSQSFFFKIPNTYTDPFYIRVYDPDTGGAVDEKNGGWDTKMSYTVYGGKKCCSTKASQGVQPVAGYRSGVRMAHKVFGNEERYDDEWYSFGPFNPSEGENLIEDFGGYVFKIITEGIAGNDGNLYRFFLSKKHDQNIPIENANAFTYEYTFRMWDNVNEISHIYPFVDSGCIYIRMTNFDWDNDGSIKVVSVVKRGQPQKISGDNGVASHVYSIDEDEINTSLDYQMIKRKTNPIKNNNVVISVENQYGDAIPFFSVPIGGVPVYKTIISVRKKNK